MSDFPEEKIRNGSEDDHDHKKQKVGKGDDEGLSALSEEERALILQMRKAKEEEQSEEAEQEGVDSSDDEGDKQKNRWLKPPSQSKNIRIGMDYQATIPSIGGN